MQELANKMGTEGRTKFTKFLVYGNEISPYRQLNVIPKQQLISLISFMAGAEKRIKFKRDPCQDSADL